MTQALKSLLVLFTLFAGHACFAQGGPPLRTDDPETPGSRHWEINVGATTEVRARVSDAELPLVDINYGLGNHIQLKLEMPLLVRFDDSGAAAEAGDGKLGCKWRFVDEEKHGINVSIYPQFSFNSPGPRRLVNDGNRFLLPVELSRTWRKVAVNGEAGVNLQQNAKNEFIFGLALGYQATPKLELLGELRATPLTSFAENDSVFQVGGRRKLSERYVLLFAFGRGMPGSTAGPSFVGYFGLQFLFGYHK